MPETSRECVVVLLDETSFSVPVKVRQHILYMHSDLIQCTCSVYYVFETHHRNYLRKIVRYARITRSWIAILVLACPHSLFLRDIDSHKMTTFTYMYKCFLPLLGRLTPFSK